MTIGISLPLFRQYVIVTIVNLGALTTGMSFIWTSPVLVKLTNGTDTPFTRPITQEEGSWIVSLGFLVAIGTNVLGGMLLDKCGRKFCVLAVSIPKLLFATWTIFVTEVWMLILCRTIMTACDSFTFLVVPVYASEIACKEHRGSLCTFLHLISCLGTVITLAVGPFLSYTSFNAFIAISIAVTSFPLLFLPDSPVYLYSKGRTEEALKVLSSIRDSDDIIKKEIEDYKLSNEKNKIDVKALTKSKVFIKGVLLGLLISMGSNAVGYNAVTFYLQTIFESTQTSLRPEISSVIIGGIQLFAAFCSSFITDKFGRRSILISSVLGMCLGMIGLGTFFLLTDIECYKVTGFLNYLPLISLVLVIFSYGIGIGNLMFVVTTELFDGQVRAVGFTICSMGLCLLAFLTSKYFSLMTTTLGPTTNYFFFSVICVIVTILIMLFLPETKDKTFNEIQVELSNRLFHIQCSRSTNETVSNKKENIL